MSDVFPIIWHIFNWILFVICLSSQSISPGGVRTEIVPQAILDSMPDMPILEAEDISQAVLYVLGTPPRVQVRLRPFENSLNVF